MGWQPLWIKYYGSWEQKNKSNTYNWNINSISGLPHTNLMFTKSSFRSSVTVWMWISNMFPVWHVHAMCWHVSQHSAWRVLPGTHLSEQCFWRVGHQNHLTVWEYTQTAEPDPQAAESKIGQGGLSVATLPSVCLTCPDAQQSLRWMLESIILNTFDENV